MIFHQILLFVWCVLCNKQHSQPMQKLSVELKQQTESKARNAKEKVGHFNEIVWFLCKATTIRHPILLLLKSHWKSHQSIQHASTSTRFVICFVDTESKQETITIKIPLTVYPWLYSATLNASAVFFVSLLPLKNGAVWLFRKRIEMFNACVVSAAFPRLPRVALTSIITVIESLFFVWPSTVAVFKVKTLQCAIQFAQSFSVKIVSI